MKTQKLVAALVVIFLLMALTGCTNLKFQVAASYQTDNLIEDLKKARHEPVPNPVRP